MYIDNFFYKIIFVLICVLVNSVDAIASDMYKHNNTLNLFK